MLELEGDERHELEDVETLRHARLDPTTHHERVPVGEPPRETFERRLDCLRRPNEGRREGQRVPDVPPSRPPALLSEEACVYGNRLGLVHHAAAPAV